VVIWKYKQLSKEQTKPALSSDTADLEKAVQQRCLQCSWASLMVSLAFTAIYWNTRSCSQ